MNERHERTMDTARLAHDGTEQQRGAVVRAKQSTVSEVQA